MQARGEEVQAHVGVNPHALVLLEVCSSNPARVSSLQVFPSNAGETVVLPNE